MFFKFIRVVKDKQPKFFVAENVAGILQKNHAQAREQLLKAMRKAGYRLYYKLLNSYDFGVPQTRQRVFFVGIRKDLPYTFSFPQPQEKKYHLKDVIWDLKDNVVNQGTSSKGQKLPCLIANHEYLDYKFSNYFMGCNRVRNWDEPSYTIVASASTMPLHPQAPKMIRLRRGKAIFVEGKEHLYRRLSIREAAKIQTFPDDFIFHYNNLEHGYKMVGNAVPVKLAEVVGRELTRLINS